MNNQDILQRYVDICNRNLMENDRVLSSLKRYGLYENYIFDNYCLGYSNGNALELVEENADLKEKLKKSGILNNGKDIFKNYITIPVYDENGAIANIIGYNTSIHRVKINLLHLMMLGYSTRHF